MEVVKRYCDRCGKEIGKSWVEIFRKPINGYARVIHAKDLDFSNTYSNEHVCGVAVKGEIEFELCADCGEKLKEFLKGETDD